MIRPRHILITGLLFGLALLASCSSTPPGPRPPVETHDPIPVDGALVHPLTMPDVYVSLEPDTRLGYHYEGAGMSRAYDYRWGPNFSAEIDELNEFTFHVLGDSGYRTVTWRDGGVTQMDTGEPVVELRPIVDLLEINSFTASGGYYQAFCTVIWELYHPGEKVPFFSTTTSGYIREKEHSAGVFSLAFKNALLNLLAEEEFVAAVSSRS